MDYIESLRYSPPVYTRRWKLKDNDKAPWLTSPPSEELAKRYRPIDLPPPALKRVQSRLAKLLADIEVPKYLFSSVKGLSYVDNAAAHLGARSFWLLDIEDFFPSCREHRIAWFFSDQLQCEPDVAAILTRIATYEGALPQGAPTSPVLSYFCNAQMWEEISSETKKYRCNLTVYADDITISSNVIKKEMIWRIKEILHTNNYKVSSKKERSLVGSMADITGVIVRGHQMLLPNRQLQKLRAELAKRNAHMSSKDRKLLENRIAGRLAQRRQITKHPKNRLTLEPV